MKGIKSNIFKVLQNSKYTDEIAVTRFAVTFDRNIALLHHPTIN